MKRILVIISMITLAVTTSYAQRAGGRPDGQNGGRPTMADPAEMIENQVTRAAKKIKVSDEQEANFNNVYTNYITEKMKLMQQSRMIEATGGEPSIQAVDTDIESRLAGVELDKKYIADFKNILNEKQIVTLYNTFMKSEIKMQQQQRGGGGPSGGAQGGGGRR